LSKTHLHVLNRRRGNPPPVYFYGKQATLVDSVALRPCLPAPQALYGVPSP